MSRDEDVHPLSCAIALTAECVRDMAHNFVFPAPEADIKFESITGARVSLRRGPEGGIQSPGLAT